MSVLMATFMLMMVPRAAVCAERIGEVLDTRSSVVPPADAGHASCSTPAGSSSATSPSPTPGAAAPVLDGITFTAERGADDRDHRQHGRRQDDAARHSSRGSSTSPPARCWSTGSTCASWTPDCCGRGSATSRRRSYLFSGTVAEHPAPRRPRRHRRASCGRRSRSPRPATSSRTLPGRARRRRSPRAARTCPAGSGSAWRSPGRSSRRPEIYLFDDAFSALDAGTDSRLRAALRPITRDAAVLVVAQRVSTILDADRIIVLDGGRIVGAGTHDELVRDCPPYAEIVQSQLSAEDAWHERRDAERQGGGRPRSGCHAAGQARGAAAGRRG